MLIIIHLPSNYTLGLPAINHALCFFFLSLSLSLASNSTARLPAGAARLAGGEVATRGQPHVSISHTQTHREEGERRLLADLLCHPFFFFFLVCHFYILHVQHIQACVDKMC